MDPVSLIVAALVAGAAAGVKSGTADLVGEAYAKLKTLLAGRLHGREAGRVALDQFGQDPQTWKGPLVKELTESGAGDDDGVTQAARSVLDAVGPEKAREATYWVSITGDNNVVGQGNNVIFRSPGQV